MGGAVRLVWAQGDGGVIGAGGELPWHLPEDLRLFRALTVGATVVMGRRTWESLPPRVRPLPGRRNVVLSSTLESAEGVLVARSAEEVPATEGDLWVIGGGSVYAAFLPRAAAAVVTEVDVRVPGDTWAPALPEDEWVAAAGTGWLTSTTGLRYRVTLSRRRSEPDGEATDGPAAVLARWSVGGGR